MNSRIVSIVATSYRQRAIRGLLGLVIVLVSFLVDIPTANANVVFAPTLAIPTDLTVGQSGVAASMQITNESTAPESLGGLAVTEIALVPACGIAAPTASGDCPLASADPGVFQVTGPVTGQVGTACANETFAVSTIDRRTGQLLFTPFGAPVLLAPPGMPDSSCGIDFTLSVLTAPTQAAGSSLPNTVETASLVYATGTSALDLNAGEGSSSELVTVTKARPTITTSAPPTATVGGSIADTADLAPASPPGPAPTGAITFRLFAPSDPGCRGTPVFTSTVPVLSGTGTYSSGGFSPSTTGVYHWEAAYGGDANYVGAVGACGDANESTNVTKATPTIVTQASAPVAVRGAISDTATLSAGASPTGTMTFTLFGPNDATCTGSALATSTVTVSGNGHYPSNPYTTTATGVYRFMAAYSGDTNNMAVITGCNDANESVTVATAAPTISTQASAPVAAGGTITDTATLTGGDNPTGTITFTAYGPDDATCTNTPAFNSTTPVSAGNGTYPSATFTATAAGTYRFVATYSGDANNAPVITGCNDANESVAVTKATPSITTHASAPVTVGGTISDTATLAAGDNPTGTITFTAYGPDDATCTNTPAFNSTTPVSAGNGTYPSATFTATAAGTYRFVATYSGDANNAPVITGCNDANESVAVTKATPSITTHASAPVTVGGTISDTATLAGGFVPAGTITFTAYGPDDASCAGTPAFVTSTAVSSGDGTYASANFTAATAGAYQFIASYGGDANNTSAVSACGDPNETVTVSQAIPTVTTHASAAVTVGGTISDSATLRGGFDPTGTITFTAYGPNDTGCTSLPAFISTTTIDGNGTYPSTSFTTTAAGTYQFVATYDGDNNNAPALSACGDPNETVTVSQAIPTVTTHASASVTVGGTVSDTATLAGGVTPTGTITFTAYGPDDPTCTNTPAFTAVTPVNAGNNTYLSGAFTTTQTGTYQFVANYSGDANNTSALSTCRATDETVTVTKAAPSVTTAASTTVNVGGTISDTATLAGGVTPTGTITFTAYGPDDASCSNTPAFTSTTPVNAGNSTYPSASFTSTAAGTYRFVASYGGDSNNNAVTTSCNDANESVVVTKATLTVTTHASASVTVGGTISDTATLTGGFDPTGTITFTAYGPDDPTCSNTPAFTSTTSVNAGDGTYGAANFTTSAAGTYRFAATYNGDANNMATVSACGGTNETVVVTKAAPTVTTHASATITVGGAITDTATLAGGFTPTGTITFSAYGPDDPTCTNTPAFITTTPVTNGNATYPSTSYSTTAAGTYLFVASYSGDSNNNTAATTCGAESVIASKGAPTVTTHASASVTVGGTISDTATLAGGFTPTGTITFSAYGPDDPTCTAAPAFTADVPVNAGNANYPSGNFTATAAGTYLFVASYNGDSNNNNTTATTCGAANETVLVTKAAPKVTTQASEVTVGGTISDTATLAGGFVPAGTITFTAYGPNDPTCIGTPAFTSTSAVDHGDGTYPSAGFTTTAAGAYQFIAIYSGDPNNDAASTSCGDPNETVAVGASIPTITTHASAPVAVGGTLADTATLAGGYNPTGTITFTAYGPDDATCTAPPAFTSTTSVGAFDGTYPSATFTSTAAGTYRFVASYSGDANNTAVTTLCNDPNESVVVGKATPTITTHASANVTVGGTISDTAALAGGYTPTGTITFTAYGPDDPTCTHTPAFTATTPVANAQASFTTTAAGTYQFVAAYHGDTNNTAAMSTCGEPTETVTANKAAPTITTKASANVTVGGTISDTATLAGGYTPTGTITFTAYGPDDPACTHTPAFTATTPIANAQASYTTTTAGTYQFVAAYHGDTNNTAAMSTCGEPTETVTVNKATPTVATHASATVTVGGTISDTAALAGGYTPTGTITFTAYGPDDPTCTTTPAFTATTPVANAQASFTTTKAGTFQFVADYSGDGNNAAATTTCRDPSESVLVNSFPQIAVTETANPTNQLAPGGNFTFTVTLSNPNSADPVTVTSLGDSVYGDLSTRVSSSCQGLIGTSLGSASAACAFTGPFTGSTGASQTDTVTATAADSSGHTVTAMAQATVTLMAVASKIGVTAVADPPSLPTPGGSFSFTVAVSNLSTDPVTITSLGDSVYGDLSSQAASTCGTLIGTNLAPAATSPCTFIGALNGPAGTAQTATLTVMGHDSQGNPVKATAQATVGITAAGVVATAGPGAGGQGAAGVEVQSGSPLAFTGLNDRPVAAALGLILMGLMLLVSSHRRRRV